MSTLKLSGVTSGSSIIKAPNSGSTGVTFTMPASAGTLIADDGSGNVDISGSLTAIGSINIDYSGSDTFATIVAPDNRDLRIDLQANDDNDSLVVRDLRDNSERFVVNAGGNVGIGTSTPDGKLHVMTGSAGTVSASSQADDLVVENSAEGGITILTPDASSARIRFSSPSTNTDVGGAHIFYRQNINKMSIGTAVAGGVLQLVSDNSQEAMLLDSNGQVTMPLQPAFSVTKTSDQSIAPGGERTITWETEEFDVGSNFASNIFTAPVSGTYFLHAMVRIDTVDTAASYYRTAIQSSNKQKYEIFKPLFTSDSSYMSMSVASIFDMDAGDTAKVTVRQQSGSTQAHIDDTGHYSNFCGYLLG